VKSRGLPTIACCFRRRWLAKRARATFHWGAELKDGHVLAADTVVVVVGIKSNAEVAAQAGIAVNRGIVVDDHLVTSTSDVFTIGECAEHRGVCYSLVEPTNEQARPPSRPRCAQPSAARTTHARSAEHTADVSGMTRQRRAKWL
jgi:NAD(P)H-nitrite reductase large subunit